MARRRAEKDRKSMLESYEKQPLDKVFALFRPYRKMLFIGFLLTIIFNMIALTVPWMLKIAVDRVLPAGDYLMFAILCVAMIIIYLSRCMIRYMLSSTVDYTGIRLIVDVRQKLFKHLQSLSLRFYEEYRTGKLISNVLSDVSLLNMFMMIVLLLLFHRKYFLNNLMELL
jgi:ABC-type bacteriocin/lantibiotic exporter with double-glycine peptidase domain